MDEEFEDQIFSDFEKQQLSQDYLFSPLPQLNTPRVSEQQLFMEPFNLQTTKPIDSSIHWSKQDPQKYIKAYNPLEMIQKMPIQKRQEYLRIANNSKNFNGLQFFFEAEDPQQSENIDKTFLQGINERVFDTHHEPKFGDLGKLFATQTNLETEKQQIQKIIENLRIRMHDSQQKSFSSIMLNKTIGPTFYEHFQNFSYAYNPTNFTQNLQINLGNFITHAKRLKGPGSSLIFSIYDFWIKTFKDFVNEIWKYSSKFTLNFFKKEKNSEVSDQSSQMKSSAKQNKEKRKNWANDQLRVLQRIIESNVIFSQSKLKQLSVQLGRSVNSISSKIQKILKSKKGQLYQQDSLLKKTIQVLKLYPEGLTKDIIAQKINEFYEMGYDGQWQKSVGQLLSSRRQFIRLKGRYRLLNPQSYSKSKMDQQIDKMTFRDKVVQCFLKFPNAEADLKSLVQVYLSLYRQQQMSENDSEQRRKSIQASISKTLSRYDIFDTSSSKTIYQLQSQVQSNAMI